jgi:malate dehydrogenase (oxaloacetate-decarboxylating)
MLRFATPRRVARAYHQLQKQPTVILKHAFLASMRDQNQVLFYRLMQDHLKELLGILYTPGAAEAVMGYSYLFRRPLGCFIVSTPSLERGISLFQFDQGS